MKTSLQQSAVLKQELRMNPRLYQAMDLLYMPLLDLQQHLKQEFETNPFLELADSEEPEAPEIKEVEKKEEKDEVDWEDILLDGFSVGGARPEYEEREYYQPQAVEATDLGDHLRDQLQLLELSERQLFVSDEFIGNIADDGYLRATLDEILSGVNGRREDELQRLAALRVKADEEEDGGPLDEPFTLAEVEVRRAGEQLGLAHLQFSSGAAHDAQALAAITPTGMIFVPSKGGRSHYPDEDTDEADLVAGASVLLQTALLLAQEL